MQKNRELSLLSSRHLQSSSWNVRSDHHMRHCVLCVNNTLNDLELVTAANMGGKCRL